MNTDLSAIEQQLRNSFEDLRLSSDEKQQFAELTTNIDDELRRFARNRCFTLFRELLADHPSEKQLGAATQWLERALKALTPQIADPQVFFSPGPACRDAIIQCCQRARSSIDICVFTISDDRLTTHLLDAHQRGVTIRIISDDDKANDEGSDIHRLAQNGIAVKTDNSPNHMHHKFALFDAETLINGSFNWTRSASERNQENVMLSFHPKAILAFATMFEQLWHDFTTMRQDFPNQS